MQARVLKVFAGHPREVSLPDGGTLRTAMLKAPLDGPVVVGERAIEGDSCADVEFHGLPDQALCLYPAAHWPGLREETGRDLGPGAFGENLSVVGLDEHRVRIGSIWRWGEVRMQVTQARSPCANLAQIHATPSLPKRLSRTARLGWYCRVLTPGTAAVGQPLKLEEDAPAGATVAESWFAKTGLDPA